MNKVIKNLSIYLLIVLVTIALIRWNTQDNAAIEEMRFDEFYAALGEGKITQVTIQPDDFTALITGKEVGGKQFQVRGTVPGAEKVEAILQDKGVQYNVIEPPRPSWWTGLLTTLLPILIFVLLFFFLMQQTQGGGNRVMSFGKSRAKLHTDDKKR